MRGRYLLGCVGAVLLTAGMILPAAAMDETGRYTMIPSTGGALRLDTRSGAVSYCGREDGEWVCREIADDRRALQSEIDRLGQENATLKRELEELKTRQALRPESRNKAPGGGLEIPDFEPDAPPEPPGEEAAPQTKPNTPGGRQDVRPKEGPDEQDIDKLVTFFERMVRRLHEMMESLRQKSLPGESL